MRKPAVLLLALLGGCWYDRPNPYNTSSDYSDYRDRTERDWLLELKKPWIAPQHAGVQVQQPDLDGWHDTVLVNADAAVLTHMRDLSVQKVASLQARAESLAPITEDSKIQIYELLWQARDEKIRLKMIEERLGAVGR